MTGTGGGPEEEARSGVWPPPPMPAGGDFKPPDLRAERRRGAAGLITALLALFVPTGGFAWFNAAATARDDLAWEEGGGFFVLVFCLLVTLVGELNAVNLGLGARRVVIGKAAVGVAATVLGGMVAFGLWLSVALMWH